MAWLGEALADQSGRRLAPRSTKDLVEEELFACRRDLFAELSVVFMDTTSLSFEGQGGESWANAATRKDYRPDLRQMIVGLVMDQDGRPLCSELWPGNTADVTTLLPVVDRLRARFVVGRICVVADRGMISAATIAELEERSSTTSSACASAAVPRSAAPSSPITRPLCRWSCRGRRALPTSRSRRSRSASDATSSAAIRPRRIAMPSSAPPSLTGSHQACPRRQSLVGNSGFRRFLKASKPSHFDIDEARVAHDALFDGLYVLRTNTKLTPLQAILRYRDRWRSSTCSAPQSPCSPPARSSTNATRPSAATCSAPFSPCSSPRNSKIASAGRPRRRMGRHPARSRPAAGNSDRARRQAFPVAHPDHRRRR